MTQTHDVRDGLIMVDLTTVDDARMDQFGIVYESTTAHRVADGPLVSRGPFMLRHPDALHTVQVWLNTRRPYIAREVQPSLRADGYRWVDPRGYPTNEMTTIMLAPRHAPERALIPSARKPIGSTLTTGAEVMINYPCGAAWVYEIKTNRWLDVPRLMIIDHSIG